MTITIIIDDAILCNEESRLSNSNNQKEASTCHFQVFNYVYLSVTAL